MGTLYIYVEGRIYTIKKKNNTLINEQVVKNIPINLDDNVTVVIIEEDLLWAPERVMRESFIFDANDVVKENKKVQVRLEFTEPYYSAIIPNASKSNHQ